MLPTNAEIEQETLLDVSASVEEPKVPKVEEKKAPVNKIFMLVKMVAHLLTIVVPLAIVVPAVMSMSFFSWHPILMSIGVSVCMCARPHDARSVHAVHVSSHDAVFAEQLVDD
jgi:hypothetical protein